MVDFFELRIIKGLKMDDFQEKIKQRIKASERSAEGMFSTEYLSTKKSLKTLIVDDQDEISDLCIQSLPKGEWIPERVDSHQAVAKMISSSSDYEIILVNATPPNSSEIQFMKFIENYFRSNGRPSPHYLLINLTGDHKSFELDKELEKAVIGFYFHKDHKRNLKNVIQGAVHRIQQDGSNEEKQLTTLLAPREIGEIIYNHLAQSISASNCLESDIVYKVDPLSILALDIPEIEEVYQNIDYLAEQDFLKDITRYIKSNIRLDDSLGQVDRTKIVLVMPGTPFENAKDFVYKKLINGLVEQKFIYGGKEVKLKTRGAISTFDEEYIPMLSQKNNLKNPNPELIKRIGEVMVYTAYRGISTSVQPKKNVCYPLNALHKLGFSTKPGKTDVHLLSIGPGK